MVKDITLRKSIEKELLQKQQMLMQAQQIAKLGSWEWDVKSDNITWSDEMYQIYGIDRKSFGSSIEAYRSLIHPDDKQLVRKIVDESLRDKNPFNYFYKI